MLTFTEFLKDAARKGELVNTMFEERLFELVGVLHEIAGALSEQGVPHELVGGLAVMVHVEAVDPSESMLTRDVDLMIRRSDIEWVKDIAARHGFRFRHAAGLDMLMRGETDSARNAVHLLISGEKVRPNQATPNPPLNPEKKQILGEEVMIIPIPDLVRMKLSAFRLKDQVHVQVMDRVGLITEEVVKGLPAELRERLEHVRQTE
jgi:hypothetical protein